MHDKSRKTLRTGFAVPCPSRASHIPDHIYDLFPPSCATWKAAARGGSVGRGNSQLAIPREALMHAASASLLLERTHEGISPNVIQTDRDATSILLAHPRGYWRLLLRCEQNADFAYALGDVFVVEGGRTARASQGRITPRACLIAESAL